MENSPKSSQTEDRIGRIGRRDAAPVHHSESYSRFVRIMRLALPLAAVAIVAVLFVVTGDDDAKIVPVQQQATGGISEKKISKAEVLSPEFQSVDKKNQPYKITATRAVRGEMNKDLVMLEKPVGVMTMDGGTQIKIHSLTGAYRQDTERFFLEGGVFLEHDDGYTLQGEEAHVDLRKGFAWSEKAVKGSGPDILVEASGLRANSKTGEIVFTGPAKLVLSDGFKGLN